MGNDPRLRLQILICLSLFYKIGNSPMFDIGFPNRHTRPPIRSLNQACPGFIRSIRLLLLHSRFLQRGPGSSTPRPRNKRNKMMIRSSCSNESPYLPSRNFVFQVSFHLALLSAAQTRSRLLIYLGTFFPYRVLSDGQGVTHPICPITWLTSGLLKASIPFLHSAIFWVPLRMNAKSG